MVAEEGNITHASELLHVSQPTVSRQLMDLERELGKTLLIRNRRSVSLTQDGLLFCETAREILAMYRKAVTETAGTKALVGDIYLGTGESGSMRFLAEQSDVFQKAHPGVRFHLISENADRICEDVEKGVLDIGLVMRKANPAAFEVLDLGLEELWGVLVPAGHPLARKKEVCPKQFQQERLILPENVVFKSEIARFLGAGSEKRAAAFYNLIHNALLLSEISGGMIVCLGTPGKKKDGWTFLPFSGWKTAEASLIWKKRPVQSPVVEAFLKQISNTISELKII